VWCRGPCHVPINSRDRGASSGSASATTGTINTKMTSAAASMLLCDVGVDLLVIPPGIFFLSCPKCYVVCDTANSCVRLRIVFSYLERDTYWSGRDATRPIKLDMP